jgi:hypothetical protein
MNKCRVATGLFLWTMFAATGAGQTLVDLRTQSKSVDFSAAASTKPMQTGSGLPGTCAIGQFFFLTTAPAGSALYACNPANAWTVEGNSLSVTGSTANEVLSSNGSAIQWLALGGDISGAPEALTVTRLQGRNVSGATPSSAQVLQWNATANQWQPAPAQAGNSSYAFAAQVSITIPGTVHQFGTANLVVDCYDNSTPPQQVEPDKIQISPTTYNVTINFSTPQTGYCVVNGAGTAAVAGGEGGTVSSVFGRIGAVMSQAGDYNFGQISGSVAGSQLPGAGGDVSGTLTAATVTGIQNRAVAGTAPANGQALVWNSGVSAWQPGTVAGGAVSSVFGRTGAVTSQAGDYSFGQISGTIGSSQFPAAGGDLSGNLTAATVTGIQSRAVSNTTPANGQALVWNSSASAWQPATVSGGGGAVNSVFGRTGTVTAQTGDYSFGQISGTVSSGELPGAGGDLSGTLTTATVKAIQGQPVSSTYPSNGQALLWNSSAGAWQAANVAGGGGATMAYQLGDLAAVRTSSTVLTIGAGCGSTSPCNVRFGYQVYTITNSATATVSGTGLGTAYIYVAGSGALTVGNNLTVTCSAGCTQQSGITSFPPNVLPIYTWTSTNGTWDTTGGHDERAFLDSKVLAGGQGIVVTEAPGQSTLAVDNGVIPTYLMNSATLNFPSINTGTCAADQSMAIPGANPGDAVAPGWPALPTGVFGIMLVSATNTVTVRLCNLSGLAVDPPSASYRATIVRNY